MGYLQEGQNYCCDKCNNACTDLKAAYTHIQKRYTNTIICVTYVKEVVI